MRILPQAVGRKGELGDGELRGRRPHTRYSNCFRLTLRRVCEEVAMQGMTAVSPPFRVFVKDPGDLWMDPQGVQGNPRTQGRGPLASRLTNDWE